MLRQHLYAHAETLDEERYRVSLRSNVADANRDFAEVEEDLSTSSDAYWTWYYRARLDELRLELPPEATVLDCACGVGRLGEAVAHRYDTRQVAFCDLSLDQLRLARGRADAASRATVQLADVGRLPYAGGSFDLVIGNSFLHHLPDVPTALGEMYRALKPGGYVVVLHEPSVHAAFWESFPVSVYKSIERRTDPNNFTDLWWFSADRLGALFSEAGFSEVRISGRGLLAALFVNAYLLVMRKLRVRSKAFIAPAQRLRVLLDTFETALSGRRGLPTAPSLLIVARKEAFR